MELRRNSDANNLLYLMALAASSNANAPCAMVPLKPNELRRDATFASPPCGGGTSEGMRNNPDDAIDARCAFSLRGTHARFFRSRRLVYPPTQLRVDGDDARQQRPRDQRRQARGRGGRLEVAHV